MNKKFDEYYKWCEQTKYRFRYLYDEQIKVISWCIEHFGPHRFSLIDCELFDKTSTWDYDDDMIYFVESNDALLFKMRWG